VLNEHFTYLHGVLCCDGISLDSIADEVGTPFYVYSAARIRANVHQIQKAFAALNPTIHYSLKANANLSLIRLMHEQKIGMDAVSAGEIYRALQAGVPAENIVYAGVGKTADEIRYALEVGVGWFNVESGGELASLNQIAGEMGKTAVAALRLNPDVQAQTHHHIATGHGGTKFGMSAETIKRILANRADYFHIHVQGIHIHIGSQLADVQASVEAVRRAQALAEPYSDIRTINIGGGFPVPYTEQDHYPAPQEFANALAPLLHGWNVKLEPGRFIAANAGALVISTLYIKIQEGRRFIITDGSMTELIRPALYEAVHPVYSAYQSDEQATEAMVVGPVCESADMLSRSAVLPPLQPGARLVVMMAGAYGMVMASNYNMRTRPPEILVENGHWRVIRRRETWQDLLQFEQNLPLSGERLAKKNPL
jgi:diaminopimelate decarboxylase